MSSPLPAKRASNHHCAVAACQRPPGRRLWQWVGISRPGVPTVMVATAPPRTGTVAVVAHREKSFGGGLGELRAALAEAGHPEPLWYEVAKSRKASKKARMAVKRGARLVFVWGGDGMVQRSLDALAGSG